MEKITITPEVHNDLVKAFQARAASQGLRGKKKLEAQAEFFVGAVAVIDVLNGEYQKGDAGETSCTPTIFFAILRGDEIKLI